MEQSNQSTIALLVSLISVAISIYLWLTRSVGPTGTEDDQPVTMSGGSILVQSGLWDIRSKKASYKSGKGVASVDFACNAIDAMSNLPVKGDFHILITYTSPSDPGDSHKIDIDYRGKKLYVTEKDEKNGKPVDDPFLTQFLNHGKHPYGNWKSTEITSSGSLNIPACNIAPETFFLRFNLAP